MSHSPPVVEEIEAACERIAGTVLRTPLVRLEHDGPGELFLKLENLQPIGSFKLRGAGNALALAGPDELAAGIWTASAGNMAQAAAWHARERGLPCTVVVPETAPSAKLDAIERLGGEVVPVPFETWWKVFRTRSYPGLDGFFLHPFSDQAVMAGNGTIGLEIAEDLPGVDAVVVPWGGGGLSCGIASALRAVAPGCKVYACEVETAAPLAPSLAAGEPVEVEHVASFVDGIGSPTVFPEMLGLARELLAGSIVSSIDAVAAAVRLLAARARVVAEGAGAASVAAALSGEAGGGTIVCVVSGGNIDADKLATILGGQTP